MKIGILTYFGAHNYGAFLQAYAMREIVAGCADNNVELINYRTLQEVKAYSVRKIPLFGPKHFLKKLRSFYYNKQQYKAFEDSICKYQTLSKAKLVSDSADEFADFVNNRYDFIIAGSDEIWKTDGFRPFPNAYWLVNVQCKKAAYAVSSRNTADSLPDSKKTLIQEYIKSFDYIGTRDKATYNLIAELSPEPGKCHMNCDPVFLYDFTADKDNGKRILRRKFGVKSSKKIIGLILSDNKYGSRIAASLNKDFEVVSLSSYIDGAKIYAKATPFEWIDLIAACDMVISSRFHGVVFSIKNNRPFLAIEMDGYSRETSKLYDLLQRNALEHCYVKTGESITHVLSNRIPEFIQSSEKMNYTADYSMVVESEKQMGKDIASLVKAVSEYTPFSHKCSDIHMNNSIPLLD